MAEKAQTVIIGGTGKTGRRVAERLAARGLPIRITARSTLPAFDWERQATWAPALEDARSAYVTYSPDLAVPGAAAAVAELAALAVSLGVRKLVLLSGRGEEEALRGERAVQQSGAEWTILRCSWFNQNFSEGVFLDAVRAGEVALPAGDTPEPFVDADDIAEAAAAALTEEGHAERVYELTGPRLLTFGEAVGEIGRATGREIRYVPISVEEYAAELAGLGVPSTTVSVIQYLFGEVLDGRNARLADGVERALGRPARDFRDYARPTASEGVWNP
jgi:uncharacterized protein YbjT (DUF2867 family)